MLLRQGFQYAMRLKPKHEALLRRWAGCRRFVFNEALAFQRAEIAAGRRRPSYFDLAARLPALKQEHPWLAEPPAQALQQALKDLCLAWEWRYTSGFGEPRFKQKGEGESLRLPQKFRYDVDAGVLHLPKLGPVRLRHSRRALGTVKNVTLKQEGQRWIAVLQTEREHEVQVSSASASVGLDLGVISTITPSRGDPFVMATRVSRYERRMRRLHQAVSRKKKGSANRRKAIVKLREGYRKLNACRRDFLHKATTQLVRDNALIAIEDLKVRAMTGSAAGTLKKPGRNVKAKSGLNRAILGNCWGMTRQMLEYKAACAGVMVVAVTPHYSSKECSACGHTERDNRLTRGTFACMQCGHTEDADANAAKVILARAHRVLAAPPAPENSSGGGPASTAGCAGTDACDGGVATRRRKPRSAARGLLVKGPLAGTVEEGRATSAALAS